MSGHSKWSTIKRQKGVTDAKRGAAFTRAANAITIAAREGGESPETNFKLRLVLDGAKKINMPKANMEKAIARGVGKGGDSLQLEEIVYEGFGPEGVAIFLVVVTDNKQRSAQEVRSVFDRGGGRLAGPGSVSYLFEQTGEIEVRIKDNADPNHLLLVAADSGAEDVDVTDGQGVIYCKPTEIEKIKSDLESNGLEVVDSQISQRPKNLVRIEDFTKAKKVLALMDKLDALDDVQKVFANFDIPDEILAKEVA
jgi:YebC/PmpR family DNA-binding regulatory protein